SLQPEAAIRLPRVTAPGNRSGESLRATRPDGHFRGTRKSDRPRGLANTSGRVRGRVKTASDARPHQFELLWPLAVAVASVKVATVKVTAAKTKANAGAKSDVGPVAVVAVVVVAVIVVATDPATHTVSMAPPAAPICRLFDRWSRCGFQFAA